MGLMGTILAILGVVIGAITIIISVDWVRWSLFKSLYLRNEEFCIVDADCQAICGCKNFLSCKEASSGEGVKCKCLSFKCYVQNLSTSSAPSPS
ncbi:MAG: hypothetical protein QW507_01210 [Candidatus Nanoarchaeia archaeon]|nr:hypothetical protein [Candidatus Haiyanarchaeum thermophilum]MCW1303434.1 hypothetical protein [Candidatus Haiyanarchaeum thermophilum]MCW1303880.1 hypothetical protein [Candidatus Haiyanarchaeum thermophilum]MCW1306865.1 hypothetical protein [Candidatus Haiyanarchaeum thermophilum]MCW1307584.1 hypothetical protein [Candidatus Haiyanarchaeum thermophilum]